MADNAQKTPVGISLNKFARTRATDQIQNLGKALPASVVSVRGAIVTVKFEVNSAFTLPNVTIPLIGSEYARPPIQPGCKGLVFPADAYLGGMSGLGGGVANLAQRGNLTALVFAPIGNAGWTTVDGNAFVIYGPNGVVLRDQNSHCVITLTPTGIAITLPGGGNIVVTGGDVIADGISLKLHRHTTSSGIPGETGPPLP